MKVSDFNDSPKYKEYNQLKYSYKPGKFIYEIFQLNYLPLQSLTIQN